MSEQKSFWVIEQYHHGELRYWRASGNRMAPSDFTPKIGDAVHFSDVHSANHVLTRICDGIGRSVEHMFVEPAALSTHDTKKPGTSG